MEKKFVYGLLARNYNNLSNKSDYDPAKVIALVDQSFTSGEDDFVIPLMPAKMMTPISLVLSVIISLSSDKAISLYN